MTEQYHRIRVKKHRTEALARRHPWVFSSSLIAEDTACVEEGDLVELVTEDGEFLARGYYDEGKIAVRVLSYDREEQIDSTFFEKRLTEAKVMRERLGLLESPNSACRLFHSEGDGVPGLQVDKFGGVFVVMSETLGIHRWHEEIVSVLLTLFGDDVKAIYYKPEPESAKMYEGVIYGELQERASFFAEEGKLRFRPDVRHGQNSGFYLEYYRIRDLLQRISTGRRVLDLFCYTGGFSIASLLGGATKVVSVDSSARCISLLASNLRCNFSEEKIAQCHTSVVGDAFEFLRDSHAGAYDLVILDPPPFAKRKSVVSNALQGYRKLHAEALRVAAPGGMVVTMSNSYPVTGEQFRQAISSVALQTNRRVRIVEELTWSPDFPVDIFHPEGANFKGYLLYVE